MINSQLSDKFQRMPKIELHVHVEGAVNAEAYFNLAQKNKVKLPAETLETWQQFFEFKDFSHFIEVYISAVQSIVNSSDYTFIIEQFYKHQQANNIIYSEVYLSASFLAERFETEEILDAIAQGIKNGEEKYKVKVQFIPDIARNYPHTQTAVLNLIVEGYKRGIFIGMGLGGLEIGYPPELFTDSFKKAKSAGLRLVAHAGEAVGPESIWGAINSLKAERIGHGIRSVDDMHLLEYLNKQQVPVEVSPKSNYCLKVVEQEAVHPIRKMIDHGVLCTLNSDDPAMFSTSLAGEYDLLHQQGFDWNELWQLNINALNASFLSNSEKTKYLNILNNFLLTESK